MPGCRVRRSSTGAKTPRHSRFQITGKARCCLPFLAAEFVNALIDDREPVIDVYESLAMTVPGIIAHQSSLKNGEQLAVPSFDRSD